MLKLRVSERANKWAQQSVQQKRAVRIKWMSGRYEQKGRRTSEWPSTSVSTCSCSEQQCVDAPLPQDAKNCPRHYGTTTSALQFGWLVFLYTIVQNRENHSWKSHLMIHFPTSSGVCAQAKQASKWMRNANKWAVWANEQIEWPSTDV